MSAPLPGFHGSLLLMRGDRILAEQHTGDACAGVPCSSRVRYPIASVSKQVTAAAVLLLAERGRLALDDPLDRWIGGNPESSRPVTLHHLLTHTSGRTATGRSTRPSTRAGGGSRRTPPPPRAAPERRAGSRSVAGMTQERR